MVFIHLQACGEQEERVVEDDQGGRTANESDGYERIALMPIEDHFELDSILIHNTYELSEGNFMMVARPIEESFTGLQMHLYTLKDSLPVISASSVPAYDSWIYLPTFFISPDEQDTLLLAETGERESWGARLLRIEDGTFRDLGFIDVALRDSKFDEELEDDVMVLKSAAQHTHVQDLNGNLIISFTADSVHVFDDRMGGIDVLYPAHAVHYEYTDSLRLMIEPAS